MRDHNGERGLVPCRSGYYDWHVFRPLNEAAARWAKGLGR